jgi:hypothetical protein
MAVTGHAAAAARFPSVIAQVLDRSVHMATWDARDWLAGLLGCAREDLTVRSTDRYGAGETQVRYDRAGESVARVIVTGPIHDMNDSKGAGHWLVSAQIGWDATGAHSVSLPESDEIVY